MNTSVLEKVGSPMQTRAGAIIVPEEAARQMTLVVNCVLTQIVTVLGSCCNLVTLLVLRRDGYKDPTNLLLLSLATWDLMFLTSLWIRKLQCPIAYVALLTGREDSLLVAKRYNAYITVYGVFTFYRAAMFVSMMHVVVLTFQRFLVVCFPLKVSGWITIKSTLAVLMTLYMLSMSMFAPFFAALEVGSAIDVARNITYPTFIYSKFYVDNLQIMTAYNVGFVSIVRGPISYFLVVFFSTVTAYRLLKADENRSSLTSSKNAGYSSKVTKMLLVICAVYIGCTSPSFILFLSSLFVPWFGPDNPQFYLFLDVEELLQAINSSANFFVYILMSKKFYQTCKNLFMCCQGLNHTKDHLSASTM